MAYATEHNDLSVATSREAAATRTNEKGGDSQISHIGRNRPGKRTVTSSKDSYVGPKACPRGTLLNSLQPFRRCLLSKPISLVWYHIWSRKGAEERKRSCRILLRVCSHHRLGTAASGSHTFGTAEPSAGCFSCQVGRDQGMYEASTQVELIMFVHTNIGIQGGAMRHSSAS